MKKMLKALTVTIVSTLSLFSIMSCNSLLDLFSDDETATPVVSDEETVSAVADEDFDPNYQSCESHSSYGNFEVKYENGTVTITPLDDNSVCLNNKDTKLAKILNNYKNNLSVTDFSLKKVLKLLMNTYLVI